MLTRRTTLALLAATSLVGGRAEAQEIKVEEMTLGAEDAPVTLVEYASFTCPHCARFHSEVFPKLKANYIDTGKVKFVYREVYFDRFGLWAAMMARCGGPEKYFAIADLLYEKQREWLSGNDPAEIVANMRRIGLSAGLTNEQIDACLNDRPMAEALVAEFQKNVEADGVNATPTLFVNGTKYSNMPYEELAAILDKELGS